MDIAQVVQNVDNVTSFEFPPWMIGLGAFIVLGLLLFIVTRINTDR
jgi:hypothetical protein